MIEVKQQIEGSLRGMPSAYKLARIPGLKWLLFILPLGYILVLMVLPMVDLFKLSLFDKQGFTLDHFIRIFSTKVYVQVLWLTLKLSFFVTFASLVIAYPVAYFLVRMESQHWKKVIFGLVLIPFWISLLVRTYAWTLLLQEQGAINKLLLSVGIIQEPLQLLYNSTGVLIGMTHVLLPYMVLSLYSVMEGIDQRLMQAAQGMGAHPWKAFLQVFFPLSLPGVLSGSLLVFVLGLGYFITPALLGGANNMMISMLISENVSTTLNWNLASAISLVLFVVTLFLLSIAYLLTRNHSAMKEIN
jgi:ABC-type spermidine/putrescine transport system permease subunit I